jgi:hypothetical protein
VKYRAILLDPGNKTQERSQQMLSNSKSDVDDWAAGQLLKAVSEHAVVSVYALQESLIEIKTKRGKP